MPFIPHTPEALLARSDSKNPGSTCNGLTANGRPCRRAISKSPSLSPERFCWQHKDQYAAEIEGKENGMGGKTQRPGQGRLRERSSVDTLVDRLGLLEVDEKRGSKVKERRADEEPERGKREERPRPRPKSQPRSNLALFFCIGSMDDQPATRPTTKPNQKRTTAVVLPTTPPRSKIPSSNPTSTPPTTPHRPSLSHHSPPTSTTTQLLQLIPTTTPPQTASLLLAELSKPPTEFDAAGYIYIFWLTSSTSSIPPPTETAPSLLLSPPARPRPGHRRTSDVINTFASAGDGMRESTAAPKTILLKIGRAQNVHRRLHQWTKQCGYDLSLIRYYPYQPSSPSPSHPPSPSTSHKSKLPLSTFDSEPHKVPYVHKVERLIHIELAGKRVRDTGPCPACGREHREWFEVEASRKGVKEVDEVVRRWIWWGEGLV